MIYLTSFYFTVETITTVGYGDFGPKSSIERIFCIFSMIIGAMAFSFASGSMASILQNVDNHSAIFEQKLTILNRIYRDYYLPLDLYTRLKQSIRYNVQKDIEDLNEFVDDLPHNLKIEVSLFLHESIYNKIPFLKECTNSFKAWICPLLKPRLITKEQYIYFENDEIEDIFFLKFGLCGFVLTKYQN